MIERVAIDYDKDTGAVTNPHNGLYLGLIAMGEHLEAIVVNTRKLKEYVAMAKDLKESGFSADEIEQLIGKGI